MFAGGVAGGGCGWVQCGHGGFREVAAVGDLPLVVGFDEHTGGQAQQRLGVGEDADNVGAAADFAVEAFQRYLELAGGLGL